MENEAAILAFFCRHLVGIGWYEGVTNSTGDFTHHPTFYGASAFLMQLHPHVPMYSLITAGHVFTEYASRMKNGGIVSRAHSLFDTWGPESICQERIPFNCFEFPAIHEYDPAAGLDFAAVLLPELFQQLLSQTIVSFTKANWVHTGNMQFDFFAMIGLPNCEAEQRTFTEGRREAVVTFQHPVVIFLESCPAPVGVTPSSCPQFYGKIQSNVDLESVVGMSGGPIIGFRKVANGQLAYWPVAIQSRWLPGQRVVIGSLLAPIAANVENWIQQAIDDQTSRGAKD